MVLILGGDGGERGPDAGAGRPAVEGLQLAASAARREVMRLLPGLARAGDLDPELITDLLADGRSEESLPGLTVDLDADGAMRFLLVRRERSIASGEPCTNAGAMRWLLDRAVAGG